MLANFQDDENKLWAIFLAGLALVVTTFVVAVATYQIIDRTTPKPGTTPAGEPVKFTVTVTPVPVQP